MTPRITLFTPARLGRALGVVLQVLAIVMVLAWAQCQDPACWMEQDFIVQYRMCEGEDPPPRPLWPLGMCAVLFVVGVASHRWGHARRAPRADLGVP